jgi:hypothetical protein
MSVWRTNRFWSVSLEYTLFLDFLKLLVNMHLVVSFAGKKTHFLDLWIKSYRCLKFQGEVWAGWACIGANQQELTTCAKSGGQEENKMGTARQAQVSTCSWPALGHRLSGSNQWSPASRGLTLALVRLFQIFLI